MNKIKDHMQSFYLSAGKNGCYALCIIELAKKIIAERGFNTLIINEQDALIRGIESGYISFNLDDFADSNNFFVKDPAKFLGVLVGENYTVTVQNGDYICRADEFEIDFWALNEINAKKGIGHFTLPGKNTLQSSNTVKCGFVYSKRIFKKNPSV